MENERTKHTDTVIRWIYDLRSNYEIIRELSVQADMDEEEARKEILLARNVIEKDMLGKTEEQNKAEQLLRLFEMIKTARDMGNVALEAKLEDRVAAILGTHAPIRTEATVKDVSAPRMTSYEEAMETMRNLGIGVKAAQQLEDMAKAEAQEAVKEKAKIINEE